MKFTVRSPKDGDTRIRKYFAIFPAKIGDELRWFEMLTVQQKYIWSWYEGWWYNKNFI